MEKLPKNWRQPWHAEDLKVNDFKSPQIDALMSDECVPLLLLLVFACDQIKTNLKAWISSDNRGAQA